MKKAALFGLWSFLFLAAFFSALFCQPQKLIDWKEAGSYAGQEVAVAGEIVSSFNSGRACFLNFHPDYQQYLSLVIFASDFPKFPPQPEKYYLNRKVRVKGRILLYRGHPEIILNSPDQIEVTGELPRGEREGPEEVAEKDGFLSSEIESGKIKEISWEEAALYYGQTVRVRGRVVAANNTGKVCFLNFHRNWRRYFTVVIFASDFHRFPQPPEKLYLNREIRVFGRVREYQGKPEMIVSGPEQIQIIH
ncbi:MAG: hypothetical protein QME85_02465 [Candidatus Saccharicenans sp.]|nr:hypothetical protein [Candidatus Saccharicenans sp.]